MMKRKVIGIVLLLAGSASVGALAGSATPAGQASTRTTVRTASQTTTTHKSPQKKGAGAKSSARTHKKSSSAGKSPSAGKTGAATPSASKAASGGATGGKSASGKTSGKSSLKSGKYSSKKAGGRQRGQMAPTPERIGEIQQALAKNGAYSGVPSGKWDDSTTEAMRKFQAAHGLNPTGKLDAQTLNRLGLGASTAGVAPPTPTVHTSSTALPADIQQ